MRRPPLFTQRLPTSYALDELRWVTIGGIPQAIHVLGRSSDSPFLLFLHGGPGVPHMPFTYVNAALADSFVVVHWDQRGAGKTFCASPQNIPRSVEDLVSDASEMVDWLCGEFGKERIIVVGHSCGSAIGALLASRHPERISAFVGLGQVTDLPSAEFIRYGMAVRVVEERGDRAKLHQLRELGPPPYSCASASDALETIAATVLDDCLDPFAHRPFARFAADSGLCTHRELVTYAIGTRASQRALWWELVHELDLTSRARRFEIPVAFIVGSQDSFAPDVLAEEYLRKIHTRHSKIFCRLNGVGHWPHLQGPSLYRAALKTVLARSSY